MRNYSSFRNLMFSMILIFMGTINLLGQSGQKEMVMFGTFANGCIISNTGDTIYGKLKLKSKFIENHITQILFKKSQGENETFDAASIQGFGIDLSYVFSENEPGEHEWNFYESKPSLKKGLMVFMNRFEKGKINVFQNRSSIQTEVSVNTEHSRIDGIYFSFSSDEGLKVGPTYSVTSRNIYSKSWFSSYFVAKGLGDLVKVEKDNYEELWPQLFGDCDDIKKETDKNPELLKFKNFLMLVKVYNQICK